MSEQKIKNWKIITSEYISRSPWFTVRRDKVELPNGNVIPTYHVLEYPSWICVVAITKEGKLLMERQYRHGLGRVAYELCAGVVDPEDVTCMDAAKRELMEETGYGNGTWQRLMVVSANPGTHNNMTYCFLATDIEKVSEPCLESTEDIAVELLEPEQVEQLLLSGEIVQAIHAASLWKYFYQQCRQSR